MPRRQPGEEPGATTGRGVGAAAGRATEGDYQTTSRGKCRARQPTRLPGETTDEAAGSRSASTRWPEPGEHVVVEGGRRWSDGGYRACARFLSRLLPQLSGRELKEE
ncbi:hypothetical protein Dimus_020183, partial [Dionaea muscipula]